MFPVTVSIQLPRPLLTELLDFLDHSDDEQDPSEAAVSALRAWLDQKRQPQAAESAQPLLRGYMWKSLFLPEGTQMRMFLRGDHDYAVVVGDRLMHRNRAVSPNQFANSFDGCVRNAWRDVSIRMPGEKSWKYADARRRELRQRLTMPPSYPSDAGNPPAERPSRGTGSAPGWDLPERSTMRYRLEDVAF